MCLKNVVCKTFGEHFAKLPFADGVAVIYQIDGKCDIDIFGDIGREEVFPVDVNFVEGFEIGKNDQFRCVGDVFADLAVELCNTCDTAFNSCFFNCRGVKIIGITGEVSCIGLFDGGT